MALLVHQVVDGVTAPLLQINVAIMGAREQDEIVFVGSRPPHPGLKLQPIDLELEALDDFHPDDHVYVTGLQIERVVAWARAHGVKITLVTDAVDAVVPGFTTVESFVLGQR